MMDGSLISSVKDSVIAGSVILLAWVGSFEWRLRSKVSHKTFDATIIPIQTQQNRMESHLWDIMKAGKIKPTVDVPDEIKNNGK